MRRIVVIGATGVGKTTLAFELSRRLNSPVIDLDDLYWLPGWQRRTPEDFAERMRATTASGGWIVASDYSRLQNLTWPSADTIIWLDYDFGTVLWRLLRRTIRRIGDRTPICNGNRETWRRFLSRDSIFVWLVTSFRRKRRTYGEIFSQPHKFPAASFVHLRNQAETDRFMAALASQ